MAFTTEALLELGLTDEQAKAVFSLRGKELNEDKAALENITQERDSLKNQLQHSTEQLEALKADQNISAEQKEALEVLQAEYDKYKEEAAAELAKTQKVNAITLALKDTNAHNPATLMKFIDVDAIELDDNGDPKLDQVIDGLKESDPYLFKQDEPAPHNPSIVSGNPSVNAQPTMTKEQINSMSYQEIVDFKQSNPAQYEQIMKGD